MLSRSNPHPRDSHITFDEGPHIYTIDGDASFTSVTKWCHSHFSEFDADKIIAKMMSSPRWPKNKYYGNTAEGIKSMWDANRDEASAAGTKLHYDIECFYNDDPKENDSVEYGYFNNFRRDFPDLKPYRTEWTIYDKELQFAGSIDMIFENPDGSLQIYDWKRSKEIVKSKSFITFATNPVICHIPDTNYWHYTFQLNTYKAILERNYGKTISDMFLVCMHPNHKNYQRIRVTSLPVEMNELLTERVAQLTKKNTT